MFDKGCDVGGPSTWPFHCIQCGKKIQMEYGVCHKCLKEMRPPPGVPCPFKCKGISFWRNYGLVSHLMDRHGFTEKEAWRKIHE